MSELQEIMGKDVMIRRHSPGIGEIAEYGTYVKCNLKGYCYSLQSMQRTSEAPFETLKGQTYQIGEGDAIPGLELALRHSRVGEKLTVYIASRFAYGTTGRNYKSEDSEKKDSFEQNNDKLDSKGNKDTVPASIPPDEDVEYEIEVLTHRTDRELDEEFQARYDAETKDADNEERKTEMLTRLLILQSLQSRKESGNRWFSYGEFARAAKAYSKATQVAEGYFNKPVSPEEGDGKSLEEKVMESEAKKEERIPEEDSEVVQLYVSCLNNLAACKLAQKEYYQAKDLCTKVLEFSPFNPKALLRAAKAALATDSYEECELCLKRLLEIEKLDKGIKAAATTELAKLRKAQALYKEKSKEMQKKIAGKLFGSPDTAAAKQSNPPVAAAINKTSTTTDKIVDDKQKPQEVKDRPDATHEEKSSAFQANKASSNLVFLLATSFVVVFLSIFLAWRYREKN